MININANIASGSYSGGGAFPTVDLTNATAIRALGDSFTVGTGATVPATGGYAYLIESETGLALTNHAVGGRGVWEAARQAALAAPAGFGNNGTSFLLVMVGLNDMRRAGSNQKTFNKILHGHRAICILKWRTSIVAAGSASVTRTGTHNNFHGQQVGGKFGDGVASIPGDVGSFVTGSGSWSYTFTGTRIAVGMYGCDGVNINWNGDFTISIDGDQVLAGNNNGIIDGISDSSNNNQRGVMTFIFGGLSSGEHTIVINAVSGVVPVDYFAVMPDPASTTCVPVLLSEIPYVEDYTKAGADQGSQSISDATSEYIKDVYEEFAALGYPITYVPVNQTYNFLNNSDGVHPNDLGHQQLAQAFLKQMTGY